MAAASSTLGMSFHSLRQEEYDGRDKKQMINKKSLFFPSCSLSPLFAFILAEECLEEWTEK